MRHIAAAWAPWFDAPGSVIKVLLPRSNRRPFRGTADAVHQYLDVLQEHAPDVVAIFAADHVYRMDVRQMIDFHCQREADARVAAVGVPLEKASSFGIISAGADGRVREFHEKPRRAAPSPRNPAQAYASMGNYLFDPRVLERALEEGVARGEFDFGRDLLPRLSREARVYAYDFAENQVPGLLEHEEPADWRAVGTLTALAAAQQDATGHPACGRAAGMLPALPAAQRAATGHGPRFTLGNRRWPIRGEHDAADRP